MVVIMSGVFEIFTSFFEMIDSFIAAIIAAFAWYESYRNRKAVKQAHDHRNIPIQVYLRNEESHRSLELPLYLRRFEFTRSELLGRIGMLTMRKTLMGEKHPRFSLRYLGTQAFLKRIDEIRDKPDDNVLFIPCNDKEFNQFELT